MSSKEYFECIAKLIHLIKANLCSDYLYNSSLSKICLLNFFYYYQKKKKKSCYNKLSLEL